MTGRLEDATAVILAGGLGTRLRPAVGDRPKVLADVDGRPFLTYLLRQLTDAGVRSIVLCVGHRAVYVRAVLGEAYGGTPLVYAVETDLLGTGGALRAALPALRSDPVLVLNGDSHCEAHLAALWAAHAEQDASATLVVTHVSDTRRFGRVSLDDDDGITRFCEKTESDGPGWINAGIYVLSRHVLTAIPSGRPVSLEHDVFPALVGRGLFGHRMTGRFVDIGTPESYRAAQAAGVGR